MDATQFESFVTHFITTLGINRQYSMVVLNPSWSITEQPYGYRQGMSAKEIELISTTGKDTVVQLLVRAGVWGCEGLIPGVGGLPGPFISLFAFVSNLLYARSLFPPLHSYFSHAA